jgi:hypothetical protein
MSVAVTLIHRRQIFAFGAVEGEQLGVSRKIVSPVASKAALAFGAKGTAEKGYDPAAARGALICGLVRPER